MERILGVDPGSHCTGYGIISAESNNVKYIDSGFIKLPKSADRFIRLRIIFESIDRVIKEHSPTQFAIEDIFYSKNARSSLVLGEARGAAILAAALVELPVHEYSPREVKQSVTGHGAADKSQVSFMLGKILELEHPLENNDESDALAIALCHAFKNKEWAAT
jgi:crossover junction endodeoxyribonuclease RuvC